MLSNHVLDNSAGRAGLRPPHFHLLLPLVTSSLGETGCHSFSSVVKSDFVCAVHQALLFLEGGWRASKGAWAMYARLSDPHLKHKMQSPLELERQSGIITLPGVSPTLGLV